MSNKDVKELWKDACRHLEELLHPDVYSRWIAVIQPVSLDDNLLTLSVDNDFYQEWLEENYPHLGQRARDRIATIINPNPRGGASPII